MQRSEGLTGTDYSFVEHIDGLNDTLYVDPSIDLNGQPQYNYKVELYSETEGYIGSSQPASTIFLDIYETDNRLELSFNHSVPWNNSLYKVFRKDNTSNEFLEIGTSPTPYYIDSNLVNHQEYCYYVETSGSYGTPGLYDPLINFSQLACGVPYDNVPPCPPGLVVKMDCPIYSNLLRWDNPAYRDSCDKDIEQYYIYYSSSQTSDLNLIDSVMQSFDDSLSYSHEGITLGCYAVTAIDSVGNQSLMSNIVCTPGCSGYELPNVFTPNNDGHNDLLIPYPETLGGVESIEISIFNRWGRIVYETTDPMVNWDGRHYKSGEECSEGTYFYTCQVNEKTLNGLVRRTIQGTVTILR